jgi:hypothetical protein
MYTRVQVRLLTDYKPLKLLQDQNKILLPTSFRANFEGFIHRLENLAKEVRELSRFCVWAAGLSDPKTKSWEQRLDRVQKDILQLYQADKLEEGTYNGLRNWLRDLVKAQSEEE